MLALLDFFELDSGLGKGQVTRAPLRWAGSKRQSLERLRQHLPESVDHYIEPFAGSACLAFALKAKKITLGDINQELIDFYHHLSTNPRELHAIYSGIEISENSYYVIREAYNRANPSLERSGMFLFLNRYCFNGIYRVNSRGYFNVPWGGERAAAPLSENELVRASEALSNAEFICADFESLVENNIREGALFYLDPPYATNEARVFREYHPNSFGVGDWDRLTTQLEKIDDGGGYFLLSYGGLDPATRHFSKWDIGQHEVTRNVGGFRASRRKHKEFLATNIIASTGRG